MNQLHRILLGALCILSAQSVFAHGKLVSSNPVNGSTVATSPPELRLQFSEPIEVAFTSVKLLGPEDREVSTDKAQADKDDARGVIVPLHGLSSGVYRAQWSTVGHDGHRVKGEIAFTVK